ncbi:MAG: hypothetical protein KDB39_19290 [Austwickia sp.]|nr:hypothetical protein [Austwickia sp.]
MASLRSDSSIEAVAAASPALLIHTLVVRNSSSRGTPDAVVEGDGLHGGHRVGSFRGMGEYVVRRGRSRVAAWALGIRSAA